MTEKSTSDDINIKDDTDTDTKKEKKPLKQAVIDELKFIAGLAAFLFLFFNFVFGHFKIPSESMQPTLEVGDHLYVNKFSYGFSKHSLILGMHKLPFLNDGRVFARMPKRGDVVVFRSPTGQNIVMIKRLVGLPGDEIETRRGRLYVNGELVERKAIDTFSYRDHRNKQVVEVTQYEEQLDGEKDPHQIYETSDIEKLDSRGPYIIPDDKFFFMGDNRDNSQDSRAPLGPGFVPFDHLIGRADMMVYSLKKCKKEEGLKCPGIRFFKML
ncbi:MAG: signal peptidase I [Hyphomonadaceae bacterium]|nr:signal peptidase I [Hyphomonadaceae bacterium]